ncbi:MAG: epimerase, partial [Candidatus Zixiibacteriota bacterium]
AVGPETFTYDELIHLIKDEINSNSKILHLPAWLSLIFSKIVGKFVNDVVITKDEMNGLMEDLLYSQHAPRGKTRLSSWLEENSKSIGTEYASELERHYLSSL